MPESASHPAAQPGPTGPRVAVIGGGPAGLMAAEVLAAGGARVSVYDAMPSVGRKFLLAGRGGSISPTPSRSNPLFTAMPIEPTPCDPG